MRKLGAVRDEKGLYSSNGEEAFQLFSETGPGFSRISPERNRRIKIKPKQ